MDGRRVSTGRLSVAHFAQPPLRMAYCTWPTRSSARATRVASWNFSPGTSTTLVYLENRAPILKVRLYYRRDAFALQVIGKTHSPARQKIPGNRNIPSCRQSKSLQPIGHGRSICALPRRPAALAGEWRRQGRLLISCGQLPLFKAVFRRRSRHRKFFFPLRNVRHLPPIGRNGFLPTKKQNRSRILPKTEGRRS